LVTPYPNSYTMLAGGEGIPEAKLIYPKAFEGV